MSNVSPYWLGALIATVWLVRKKLIPLYVTPLLSLRGPPSASILYGNFQQVGKVADPLITQQWMQDYGSTFLARIFLLVCSLLCCSTSTRMTTYNGVALSSRACGLRIPGRSTTSYRTPRNTASP